MIAHLEVGELEPVRRRDHHHALLRIDQPARAQLDERGQRHAGVRAVEHAGAIGARRRVGQLGLARLLDDARILLQRADRLLDRHRVADLDRDASVGRAGTA